MVVLERSSTVGYIWGVISLGYLISEPKIMYQLFYLVFSVLGVAYDRLLLSVLLLDVVFKYSTLTNVLRAVVLKGRQLVMVLMLTLVFIYIFSTLAFMSLRHYYYVKHITNLHQEGNSTGTGGFDFVCIDPGSA